MIFYSNQSRKFVVVLFFALRAKNNTTTNNSPHISNYWFGSIFEYRLIYRNIKIESGLPV